MNKTLTMSIQWKIHISTKMSRSENAICLKHHRPLLKNAQEPKNCPTGTSDLVMRLIAPFSVSLDLISKSMTVDAKPVYSQKRLGLRSRLLLKRLLRSSNSSIPTSAAQILSPSAEAFTLLHSSMISAAAAGTILFSAKARLPYWSHSSSLSRMQKTRPNARSKPFGLMAEASDGRARRAAPEPEWPGPTRPRPRPSLARSGGPGQKFLRPDRASGGPGYRVEKFGRAGMRHLARPDPPGPARVWPDINVA